MFIAHALLFFLLLFNLLYAHTAASGWLQRNTFKKKHIKTLKKKNQYLSISFLYQLFRTPIRKASNSSNEYIIFDIQDRGRVLCVHYPCGSHHKRAIITVRLFFH